MKILVWMRRDIRLHDHHALWKALKESTKVYIVFNFDPNILNKLANKKDRRIQFIIESLEVIESKLQDQCKSSIHICYGQPEICIVAAAKKFAVNAVYCNRDYEPYAKQRDAKVEVALAQEGIAFTTFKDHVIFESHEVLKKDQTPYHVFTPYKNKWLECFNQQLKHVPSYQCNLQNLAQVQNPHSVLNIDWQKKIGFESCENPLTGGVISARTRLKNFERIMPHYQDNRDFPNTNATSMLSVYLRHGCLSIRDLLKAALRQENKGSQCWLSELIWREFYQMILCTYPKVVHQSFKPQYDNISWPGDRKLFQAWCLGHTGYPLVDAAMRCLNQTGIMHNRLRMLCASFLCKTLLVDWRKGEQYFAQKLLDYDLAANNGGWQWCASSGCDAQPYFRIFNPTSQMEKFDPNQQFVKKWLPEFATPDYPDPIVDYKKKRQEALSMYKKYT